MNKKFNNIPFYILFGISLIALVIGYFYDLNISNALYVGRNNGFCRFFAAIGPGIPFLGYCFYGGVLFMDTLSHKRPSFFRLILLMYGIGECLCGWYVASDQFSGYNGYDMAHPWIAFLCILPLALGMFYLGMKQGKKIQSENLWIVLVLMPIVVVFAYGMVVTGVKLIMHRPRYREMVDGTLDLSYFHNCLTPFKDYKTCIETLGTYKDEFKSMPSGHSSTSALLVMMLSYLPFVFPKLNDKRPLLFGIGLAYTCLIMLTRIMIGAHFLTDVTTGFLSTIFFTFILNNILNKIIINKNIGD